MIYGYFRVSTFDQEMSLDAQWGGFIKFVKEQNVECRIYEEIASGKSLDGRKELQKMMLEIESDNDPIKQVWVSHPNRLTTCVEDACRISDFCEKNGVQLLIDGTFHGHQETRFFLHLEAIGIRERMIRRVY